MVWTNIASSTKRCDELRRRTDGQEWQRVAGCALIVRHTVKESSHEASPVATNTFQLLYCSQPFGLSVWAILGGPSRSFARPLSTHIALGTRALNNTPELRSLYIYIGPRIDPTCRWKLAYASKTQCDEITNTVAHTHGFRRVKSLRKETFHATKMVLSGQFTGIVSIVECIKLSLDGFTIAAFSNTACIQDYSFHICPAFKYFQWRIS